MRRFSRFVLLVLVVLFGFSGCNMFHNLQQHRLMKMNHSTNGTGGDVWN